MAHITITAVISWSLSFFVVSFLIIFSACSPGPGKTGPESAAESGSRVFKLAAEVERIAAERSLWPGFDPLAVPLAIYDGEMTWLFRHPSPPESFFEAAGTSPAASAFEGRHPDVTANTSTRIGGRITATLLLDPWPEDRQLRDLAALTLHESFHVYQRENHSDWIANEATLFTYPFDDPNALTLLRSEILALRLAFEAEDDDTTVCWTLLALKHRKSRFLFFDQNSGDPAFAAYERGTELNEGLASYVEHLAAGRGLPDRLFKEHGPEEVRSRAYATGLALALLLDRYSPGWQEELNAGKIKDLDTALTEALGSGPSSGPCDFTAEVKQGILDLVFDDLERIREEREQLRSGFVEAPGWRLVFEAAEDQPLQIAGFDPLNVRLVDGGVLHTRYIKLGNVAGTVEVLGGQCLTESAGSHPLFEGISRLVLTGLEEEPVTVVDGETIRISAQALTAAFDGALVERTGSAVTIRLP